MVGSFISSAGLTQVADCNKFLYQTSALIFPQVSIYHTHKIFTWPSIAYKCSRFKLKLTRKISDMRIFPIKYTQTHK